MGYRDGKANAQSGKGLFIGHHNEESYKARNESETN